MILILSIQKICKPLCKSYAFALLKHKFLYSEIEYLSM